MDKTWFEMKEIRKRHLSDAVWVPLRVSESLIDEGTYGFVGYKEEFYGLGSVAIPIERRGDAEKLDWMDIGIMHSQRAWADGDYYKPAEIYQYNDRTDLGVELVLVQEFDADEPNEWHLNQDIVFALGLKREGDKWLRPIEDYVVVAQLRRNQDERPIALEIRNEFLRDYLCARSMFLHTSMYRNRDIIVEDIAQVGSPDQVVTGANGERFELRVIKLAEGGFGGDGSYSVFNVSRNDIDPDEDVPLPGPETASNTTSRTWEGIRGGRPLFRVMGEMWREEDIEPGAHSVRVRHDKVPMGIQYIVDAGGSRLSSEDLDDEDNARWLWFRPEVVPAITKRRGARFKWYTQETGGVGWRTHGLTHFGLNKVGLVTVYAYDIAKLDAWQQRIWAGYNVAPEGGVSRELLSAQMETRVAETSAPETVLPIILEELNNVFTEATGAQLFRSHMATTELIDSISRFRALEPGGLFALAKDLMRLIADRIDTASLQKLAPPPKGERWGSLKSLEKYLATIISAENARLGIGPLFGAYDLRIEDAHLPSEDELSKPYALVRVDAKALPLEQGFWLIASVVSALMEINAVVAANLRQRRDG